MSGVWRVFEITKIFYCKKVKYYVLTSVENRDSAIYIPFINNKLVAKMRKVIIPQKIYYIIRALKIM